MRKFFVFCLLVSSIVGCAKTPLPEKSNDVASKPEVDEWSPENADPAERVIQPEDLVGKTLGVQGYTWRFDAETFELTEGKEPLPAFVLDQLPKKHRGAKKITGRWQLDQKRLTLRDLEIDGKNVTDAKMELLLEGDGPVVRRLMLGNDVQIIGD